MHFYYKIVSTLIIIDVSAIYNRVWVYILYNIQTPVDSASYVHIIYILSTYRIFNYHDKKNTAILLIK